MPVKNARGYTTLPRPKLADYTWLSVHMPVALLAVLREAATSEDRPVSSMARRLIEEGLIKRGHVLPKRGAVEETTAATTEE